MIVGKNAQRAARWRVVVAGVYIYRMAPALTSETSARPASWPRAFSPLWGLSDMDGFSIFFFCTSAVLKVKVQDCERYTTCSDCLGAKDPYCGWCSLENKCSQRKECKENELSQRWLSYISHECPRISRIQPNRVQRDKERLLTLDIQNLPGYEKNSAYKCRFSQTNSSSQSRNGGALVPPYTTEANRTRDNFQCYTPPKAKLPPFDDGK
ncbi:THAP domain-containing protein 5-like isoform x1, partial [Plakobranchus ocellatus]